MVPIKINLARKENFGRSRTTSSINYIVVHYSANDGDHDESNGNYFHNNVVKASAHYFVDDDSITQSVLDENVAYAVGGKKYADCDKTGGGKYYGVVTNSNSISIEMCDTKKDGIIQASEKTQMNTIELIGTLMKKYNIPLHNVVRHFDVNGKHCPAYFMDDSKWNTFKNKIAATLVEPAPVKVKVETKPTKVEVKVESKPAPAKTTEHIYKVTTNKLNIRKGPGTNYGKVEYITPGSYTIVEVKSGQGSNKGWGKLKSGKGWISLDYTTKVR